MAPGRRLDRGRADSGAWRRVGKTRRGRRLPRRCAAACRRSGDPRANRGRGRTAASPRSSARASTSASDGEPARFDDEGDALVAVEPGDRGQRATLDLDDRDPQARGVEDELLERVPSLRNDEQAMGGPAGGEHLLDRAAAGHQLLVRPEQVGSRHAIRPDAATARRSVGARRPGPCVRSVHRDRSRGRRAGRRGPPGASAGRHGATVPRRSPTTRRAPRAAIVRRAAGSTSRMGGRDPRPVAAGGE